MGKWAQIIAIWVLVAIATGILLVLIPGAEVEAAFGAVLAGSIALVSLLQLFSQSVDGFVRRLVYVAGGSYLILALATAYVFLKG